MMIYKYLDSNMCNFHPLEVVGLGSETQFQMGDNFLGGEGLKRMS